MRNSLLIVAAILWLFTPSPAQNADELAALRKHLRVPETLVITPAKSPQLPTERPLKIYMDTAGDTSASSELVKLIQDINKKQADKYGPIEVTEESSKANLWLIHYEVPGTRHKDTDTSNSMDPALGRGQTQNVLKAEVRGYIMIPKPEGLEVLSRYKKEVTLGDRRQELRDAFSKLLKEQGKSEKH